MLKSICINTFNGYAKSTTKVEGDFKNSLGQLDSFNVKKIIFMNLQM